MSHKAVFYDRMKSCMGRNVQVCCESFSMSLADDTGSLFSVRAIDDVCSDKVEDGVIRNVKSIIHRVPKKEATKLLAITFSNLNRFSKFFHCRIEDEYFQQNCVIFSTTP